MFKDGRDKEIGIGFVLNLKPVKNDALSAGKALRDMLKHDPVPGDQTKIPLFRNPNTGKELTYTQSAGSLAAAMRHAGLAELASGVHSLRIGGATALACAEEGGEKLAIAHGGWISEAAYNYLFEKQGRMVKATARMARMKSTRIEGKNGNLSAKPRNR